MERKRLTDEEKRRLNERARIINWALTAAWGVLLCCAAGLGALEALGMEATPTRVMGIVKVSLCAVALRVAWRFI